MCYSAVRHYLLPCGKKTFDLHISGTPPTFILSQDQTLKKTLQTHNASAAVDPNPIIEN